jgi:hypothetical protein
MFIAIALIIIVAGSALFHLFNPRGLTPLASKWKTEGLARGPDLTGAGSTTKDFASAASLPLLLDLPGILIGAGFNHHQDTAIADACFVHADSPFRNAPIAERSNEPGYEARGAGARQRRGDRARHDKAKGGQRQCGAHCGEDGDQDFDPTSRRPSKLAALGLPARQQRRGLAAIRKESFACVLGHDDVHFADLIAALDARLVCALNAFGVAEQACDHSAVAAF